MKWHLADSSLRLPLPTVIIYSVLSGVWILLSDRLLAGFVTDMQTLTLLQTYKGWAFVLASALLLYGFLHREFEQFRRSLIDQHRAEEELNVARKLVDASERTVIEILAKLNEAQQVARIGNWEWNLTEGSIWWSDELYRIFDLDPRSFTPTLEAIARYIHPDDYEMYQRELNRVLDSGGTFDFEARIISGAGITRYCQCKARIDRDNLGRPLRMFGTVADVSEKRRVELALQASESRYRSFFENSLDAILLTVPDGRIISANPAACAMFGYSEDELVQVGRAEVVDGTDARLPALLAERSAKGKVQGELTFRRKDGTCFPGEISSALFTDAEGRVQASMIVRNVAERKKADEKERLAHDRLRRFIDSNIVGVVIAAADGRVIEANDYYLKMVGYSRKEFESGMVDWRGMTPPEWLAADEHAIQELRQTKTCTPYEKEYVHRNGTRIAVLLAETMLPGPDEQIAAFVLDMTDRKKAEERLRHSERSLAEAERIGATGSWEYDLATDTAEWSENMFRIFDVDPAMPRELVFKYFVDHLVHPDDRAHVFSVFQDALAGKQPYDLEYRIVKKNGDTRQIHAIAETIFDAERKTVRLIGKVEDITERKRAEELIRETNEYLENLFNHATAPVVVWDPALRITRFNHAFEQLSGFSAAEVIGKTVDILFSVETRQASLLLVNKTSAGEKWEAVEMEIARKDNDTRIALWNSANIYDKAGKAIVATIAQGQDITERKKTEKALSESLEQLRFALTGTNDGVWDVRMDTGAVYLSPRGCEILGYRPEELHQIAERWHQLVNPEDLDATNAALTAYLEGRSPLFMVEQRLRTKSDDWKWILARGKAVSFDSNGKPSRMVGTHTDISDRKAAEAEVAKLNATLEQQVKERTAQLEAANKELEAFSYSVSHDLRAPLRHISGYVDLLVKRYPEALPDTGKRYLNTIADSVVQMGTLIDDLLQFSRSGRTELHRSEADMDGMVRDIVRSVIREAPKRDIEWIIGPIPSVVCDQAMLRLVWMNLLGNAVKFTRTRERARIEIGMEKGRGEYVFFVRDNGVGFDMKYAQRLFGVFQRLHAADQFEGTGIGLANVRRIVLRHGGRTWAEAALNIGATFYFTLPARKEQER